MALRKKKTCDGCKALREVCCGCDLNYKMEKRTVKVTMGESSYWWMSTYHPLEPCTKPRTIKRLMTLKGY